MAPTNSEDLALWAPRAVAILGCAALIAALLIIVLRPVLERYVLARPNARSSHKMPTPQGGGIAVIASTVAVTAGASFLLMPATISITAPLVTVLAAVILIAVVGAMADLHPVAVAPRLLLQTLAVVTMIFALPAELRVLPVVPWWLERVALIVGGLWFVNLVNFMDGLDWMTVAEVVPISGALAVIGMLGVLPAQEVLVALSLCGAMIGFAFFNRPVAKLFLGDVGSLPIGLVLGFLLLLAAGSGGRAAAILLPLYYLADSTITLVRRAKNGEQIWQAHRTHYYQRATDNGLSVIEVVGRVFFVNLILAALALATVLEPSRELDLAAILVGALAVACLLYGFARGRWR